MERLRLLAVVSVAMTSVGLVVSCLPDVSVPDAAKISCEATEECPADFVCNSESSMCVAVSSCIEVDDAFGIPVNEESVCQTSAGTEGVCSRGRCKAPFCGDGEVDASLDEECDDGALNSNTQSNACREDCSRPACGDGVLDAGEECDTEGLTSGGAICSTGCYFQCPIGHAGFDSEGKCDLSLELVDDCIGTSKIIRARGSAYALCASEVFLITEDGAHREFHTAANFPEAIAASETRLILGGFAFLEIHDFESGEWTTIQFANFESADVIATLGTKVWFASVEDEVYAFDTDTGMLNVVASIEGTKNHMSISEDETEVLIGTIAGQFVALDIATGALTELATVERGIAGAILTDRYLYWLDEFGATLWSRSRADSTEILIASATGRGVDLRRAGDDLYFLAGHPQDSYLFRVPMSSPGATVPKAIASLFTPTEVVILEQVIVVGDENLEATRDTISDFGGIYTLDRAFE